MQRSEGQSTVHIPVWLAVAALSALFLRIGIMGYEHLNPPSPDEGIQWLEASDIPETIPEGKLLLYDFSADWCQPCKLMQQTTFQDRTVVNQVKARFLPIEIMNRKGEDLADADPGEELALKYKVRVYPTFVVALPDGYSVTEQMGYMHPQAFLKYLDHAEQSRDFARGKQDLLAGNYESAAAQFKRFLKEPNWGNTEYGRAAVYCYLSYLNSGQQDDAARILNIAMTNLDKEEETYKALSYFHGDVTRKKLLKEAKCSFHGQTHLRCYLGLFELSNGEKGKALKDFDWVDSKGSGNHFDFDLSIAALKRLSPKQTQN